MPHSSLQYLADESQFETSYGFGDADNRALYFSKNPHMKPLVKGGLPALADVCPSGLCAQFSGWVEPPNINVRPSKKYQGHVNRNPPVPLARQQPFSSCRLDRGGARGELICGVYDQLNCRCVTSPHHRRPPPQEFQLDCAKLGLVPCEFTEDSHACCPSEPSLHIDCSALGLVACNYYMGGHGCCAPPPGPPGPPAPPVGRDCASRGPRPCGAAEYCKDDANGNAHCLPGSYACEGLEHGNECVFMHKGPNRAQKLYASLSECNASCTPPPFQLNCKALGLKPCDFTTDGHGCCPTKPEMQINCKALNLVPCNFTEDSHGCCAAPGPPAPPGPGPSPPPPLKVVSYTCEGLDGDKPACVKVAAVPDGDKNFASQQQCEASCAGLKPSPPPFQLNCQALGMKPCDYTMDGHGCCPENPAMQVNCKALNLVACNFTEDGHGCCAAAPGPHPGPSPPAPGPSPPGPGPSPPGPGPSPPGPGPSPGPGPYGKCTVVDEREGGAKLQCPDGKTQIECGGPYLGAASYPACCDRKCESD